MTRYEFIDRLRAALNGRIPTAQVTDTINYYEEYIVTEIRKGRTEEEVLDLLGDPRLIAKTIIQTCPAGRESADGMDTDTFGSSYSGEYQNSSNAGYGYDREDVRQDRSEKHIKISRWLWSILLILIVVVVFAVAFRVLYFFAPLIIVMASVILMVKLFRDWLN